MPHDRNGSVINVGDTVNVPMVVKNVNMTDLYCNVTLETIHSMPPDGGHSTMTLNTKQVVKIED